MAFEGMDPGQVQAAIGQLNNSHQSLQQCQQTLSKVAGETPGMWKGPDAQKFVSDLQGAKSDVARAAQHITALIQHAKSNLSAQTQTSSSY